MIKVWSITSAQDNSGNRDQFKMKSTVDQIMTMVRNPCQMRTSIYQRDTLGNGPLFYFDYVVFVHFTKKPLKK